ncbi:hypothetical protein BH11BAC5_BH11BAC5_31310 [soil metagenome]
MNDITAHVFRLAPGEDLKQRIEEMVTEKQIQAGWIGTCIGSLTRYQLRFANAAAITSGAGYFEIVCVAGTVSCNGSTCTWLSVMGTVKQLVAIYVMVALFIPLQKLSLLAAINMFLQGYKMAQHHGRNYS